MIAVWKYLNEMILIALMYSILYQMAIIFVDWNGWKGSIGWNGWMGWVGWNGWIGSIILIDLNSWNGSIAWNGWMHWMVCIGWIKLKGLNG